MEHVLRREKLLALWTAAENSATGRSVDLNKYWEVEKEAEDGACEERASVYSLVIRKNINE